MLKNKVSETYTIDIACKFCGDIEGVVKFGTLNGVQRYFCKKCGRKFVNNNALPSMRTAVDLIGSALSMFYRGMSFREISEQFEQDYKFYPSKSTIYGWVIRFTKKALWVASDYKAKTGNVWIADETVLKIGGRNIWFWDVIDYDTRFLLASHISLSRTIGNAQKLFIKAVEHSEYIPDKIITDKLAAYSDGIETVLGAYTKHISSKGFIISPNTNTIERFHGTLKDRFKIMRGMKNQGTAKLITDGWLIHYNFFRPHESLKGKTPANQAGIKFPFRNWAEVVKKDI